MNRILAISFVTCLFFAAPASAFNGHIVTEGPLKLTIGDIKEVTQYDKARDVTVTLNNNGTSTLNVHLKMTGLVDEWYAVGQTQKRVTVNPGKQANATFQIAAAKGAFSALYPVHVYATFKHDGKTTTAHAVQICNSNFKKPAVSSKKTREMPVNAVPANATLPLWTLQTHRVAWSFYDSPLTYMPIGWQGSAPESSATFSTGRILRGTSRYAVQMHPPWKPQGGTIFAEYLLRLPNVTPIKLVFANAIRDHSTSEPPSDGVTFRVWAGDEMLFERHTDNKVWVDAQVDLSKFTGQHILLRLESHPGPKRDTTCDSSYWAEPTIVAGTPAPQLSDTEREKLRNRARSIIASGKTAGKNEFIFKLDDDYTAALVLGSNGLADSAIAFGRGPNCVVFDGLGVSVLGHKVGAWPSPIVVQEVNAGEDRLSGKLIIKHHLWLEGEKFDLTANVWKDRAGLRINVTCPKRVTDMALGPADQKAPRVYYGHGYCIVEPQAFRASFGGHNLSTSHVGLDFAKDISLLVASDNPPDYLEVDPDRKLYALHTHLDATMTFVPSINGAFDCAIRYRLLFDKKAAPGFKRKAGRFVFDIWGGRYAEIAETMKQMIAYGLTDSLLTVHVWQRWGYDYRLPDIYPPLPSLGAVEDMQQIAAVCDQHDIPWGLHDNYIDFYPDATDYSYEHVCFTEQGTPVKAWLNEGRNAQSYRWRPDHIMPFVQRNLKLIKPNLRPTHYFIDVFTSLPCFDYYDKQGNFHSMLETRKWWGEAFAWIRDYLGDNAPMTSEAGHDQLIGYLDGSDCQHLQLTPADERFCIRLPCKDWERVPWFDAVLHDKFSLHGVGYSGRYQGGRSRRDYGIESDDYISAEVLEGHALMIDRPAFGRGAVGKYWLAQDFIRSIACDSIEKVEFVGDDIHRQVITWRSGAQVYVNRGDGDWTVAGKTLPQYGYFAKNGRIESSIERINGIIVEQSRGPEHLYVNARSFNADGSLAIRPMVDRVEYLGGRKFKLILSWDAQRPTPKDLAVFVHFNSDRSDRADKIAFQGDGWPTVPTSTWKGRITTGADRIVEIPERYVAGKYDIVVGLWDPAVGRRYPLMGDDAGSLGYRLGTLAVDAVAKEVTDVRLVRHNPAVTAPERWNAAGIPIDFGPVFTEGGLRCVLRKNLIVVTPLPGLDPFTVSLRIERLTGPGGARAKSVLAVDAEGPHVRNVNFHEERDLVRFQTRKNEFAYHVLLDRPSPY